MTSEEERTGVTWIVQQLQCAAVNKLAPHDRSLMHASPQLAGKLPTLLAKVFHRRHRRALLLEGFEEPANRVLHLAIWFQHYTIFFVIDESNR